MKKLLLTALAILVVLAMVPVVQAQTAQDNATVTATINTALGITKNTDVDFGGVQQGSTPVLDPQGTGHSQVGAGAVVGDFSVTGTNGAVVVVTYTGATLEDASANTLTFTSDLSWDASAGNQASSTDIASGNTITLGASGATLWLGGSLGDLTGQAAGAYSTATGGGSPVTVTVEYQ